MVLLFIGALETLDVRTLPQKSASPFQIKREFDLVKCCFWKTRKHTTNPTTPTYKQSCGANRHSPISLELPSAASA